MKYNKKEQRWYVTLKQFQLLLFTRITERTIYFFNRNNKRMSLRSNHIFSSLTENPLVASALLQFVKMLVHIDWQKPCSQLKPHQNSTECMLELFNKSNKNKLKLAVEKRKPNHQHTLQAIATLGFWKNCLILVKISNKLKY